MKGVQSQIDQLHKEAEICAKKSQELSETEHTILSCMQKEEQKIEQAVALIIVRTNEKGDIAKTQLRDVHDGKLQDCQRLKVLMQKQAHDLQHVVTDVETILNDTSSHDFMTQYKAISDKLGAKMMERVFHDEESVHYTPGEVEFVVEPTPPIRLGTILQNRLVAVACTNRPTVMNCDSREKEGTATTTRMGVRHVDIYLAMKQPKSVISIASDKNGNILAFTDSKSLQIYRGAASGQYYKDYSIDMMSYGTEKSYVTIGNDGRYLVAQGKCLHVFSNSYRHEAIKYTSSGADYWSEHSVKLCSISTTPEGKILVADKGRRVITVHAPDGRLLLALASNTWHHYKPRYITAVNNTYIAISDQRSNVIVIDRITGRTILNLNFCASSVCYDRETCCLLVTPQVEEDAPYCCIEQYSLASGRFVKNLQRFKDTPMALTFLGDKIMAVGGHKGITIFNTKVTFV